MKIEEYLGTLPENILSGEDVQLPERAFCEMFEFAGMGGGDVFYHLGCVDERGIEVAARRFGVSKAVGIDSNAQKVEAARGRISGGRTEVVCADITEADLSEATVILFWFAGGDVTERMTERFRGLRDGTRIITVWGPLPGLLPSRVRFPYVINSPPFREAESMQDQVLAVFGVKCVDFVTAWEFAERYTRSISDPGVKNDRFLTIIQALTIWINAKRLGVACGEGIPEPIRAYIGIMRMHFGIDFGHLLDDPV